jgi:hypothetical protein
LEKFLGTIFSSGKVARKLNSGPSQADLSSGFSGYVALALSEFAMVG